LSDVQIVQFNPIALRHSLAILPGQEYGIGQGNSCDIAFLQTHLRRSA
jgi:hypothetical protein